PACAARPDWARVYDDFAKGYSGSFPILARVEASATLMLFATPVGRKLVSPASVIASGKKSLACLGARR
ncbi:hypothetical protein, partial [Endozoicomonas sp. YOMI1]|uniref:hypothetical protein n=1 Tax=Endozoicomonas sp. YOMI1 TaxID=2828739 RepID=UPI002148F933